VLFPSRSQSQLMVRRALKARAAEPVEGEGACGTPNRTSSITTRVGIVTGHLALGATSAAQTMAASCGAPTPSTQAPSPSPTVNPK
jgi:hypothetical protein